MIKWLAKKLKCSKEDVWCGIVEIALVILMTMLVEQILLGFVAFLFCMLIIGELL